MKNTQQFTRGNSIFDPRSQDKRWIRRGTIVEKKKNRNTYLVEASGRRYLRNRKFLRPCLNQDQTTEEPEEKEQFELRRSKRHCVTQNKKVRFGKEIFI